ncbi:TPA: S-layer protein [archaeon]|uniref:S-layer protein n=1 Tax=Candidatus Undinarchaeum marinum TaxID=2756141 RepID=A0A832UZT5_9ARCH|nr:S-layer protein [Candidatus Undinarchaeum marinum]
MQNLWKKVGAAFGSAVMIGATLAGAALAQTGSDLGDYNDLIVTDGAVSALYVVGANAATADVVSAMGLTAWAGNQQVSGTATGAGTVTLTPLKASADGVTRHVEIDHHAEQSYEFSTTASSDKLSGDTYASGDSLVDFLYSHKLKGPIYINSTEYNWHEELSIDLSDFNLSRDTLDSNAGDQYDELIMSVESGSMQYKWTFDNSQQLTHTDLQGEKMWFMGEEYTIVSVTNSKIKLGASDAELVLTSANPSATVADVDVVMGGVFSAGAGSTSYKAKMTLTNDGTTETKYVNSGTTETVAGIEVYVKNAVVTTSGTNEGEVQAIIGAGIVELTDGDYLKFGDGTESTWIVTKTPSNANRIGSIVINESQSHTSKTGDYLVLSAGDSINVPSNLFGATYIGLTDKDGNTVSYRTVNIQPETKNLGRGSTTEQVVRVRTPDGNYVEFTDSAGNTRTDDEMWVATNQSTGSFYWKNETGTTTVYSNLTSPVIRLSSASASSISWKTHASRGTSYLNLSDPALSEKGTVENLSIVWSNATNKFDTNSTTGVYMGYAATNLDLAGPSASKWIARKTNYTTAVRDYYTLYGHKVSTVGTHLITIQMPEGQTYGELVLGQLKGTEGTPITANAGETITIGGEDVRVGGGLSADVAVTLPSTIGKVDSAVTSADKAAGTLVLVGGPAVNTLVTELQTTGKLTTDIAGLGAGGGVVELVADAFADGNYAVVVAGSDRAGTAKAANVLANFDSYASELDGMTVYEV